MAESATPSTGFSISGLFENPDFLRMLAGIGTEMDPTGAAGIIGRAATTMIKSKAAAKAGEQTLNEDGDVVTRKLGPITPSDKLGPNSIKTKRNGSLDIDVNTDNSGKLIDTLGGYSPLGQEGINSLSRTPSGSLLVNYDPPKQRLVRENPISTELASLEAAPTAARDRNKLSYTPVSQEQVVNEVGDLIEPWTGRRRLV